MFAWFQRLLPKTGNFFALFEAQAATILAGAEATVRLFDTQGNTADEIAAVAAREHAVSYTHLTLPTIYSV